MSQPDIQVQIAEVERFAQQVAVALRNPTYRKQRVLLKEGRALLARAFRAVEAAKLAAKEALSSEDAETVAKVEALRLELLTLEAALPALIKGFDSGQDILPSELNTPSATPPASSPSKNPTSQPAAQKEPPPKKEPVQAAPKEPAKEISKEAPKEPPKESAEPQPLRYFDMVRLKVKPHPAQINAAHEASMRIGSRAQQADDLVETRQQRIDKLMEMVGVNERTAKSEKPAPKPYPDELLPGTSERPLILHPKKKKRTEH